jgi:uncharacterized protein YndB with AHSA1/START domain
MSTATLAGTTFPPLVRTVTVRAAPDAAFRRFTDEMNTWWPLATHSVGQSRARSVEMQPAVGGRIIETLAGGEECVWGTVVEWDPPRRVAFTWHPGREPDTAQDIEVRFEPAGEATQVTLTHTGFERLGSDARAARRAYPLGWTYVMGLYGRRGGPLMALLTALTWVMSRAARRREVDRGQGN